MVVRPAARRSACMLAAALALVTAAGCGTDSGTGPANVDPSGIYDLQTVNDQALPSLTGLSASPDDTTPPDSTFIAGGELTLTGGSWQLTIHTCFGLAMGNRRPLPMSFPGPSR